MMDVTYQSTPTTSHKHHKQSVPAFLAARGCPYLEGKGSAVDMLTFLATELQVRGAFC